jgi:hypothetical protein
MNFRFPTYGFFFYASIAITVIIILFVMNGLCKIGNIGENGKEVEFWLFFLLFDRALIFARENAKTRKNKNGSRRDKDAKNTIKDNNKSTTSFRGISSRKNILCGEMVWNLYCGIIG